MRDLMALTSLGRAAVVVTVRERLGPTSACLATLLAKTPPDVPVIVILPPCPPAMHAELAALHARRPIRIVDVPCGRTHNADRNLGARLAGDVDTIAFVENDSIVPRRWLERLMARAEEQGADVVGPLVLSGRPWNRIIHTAGNEFAVAVDEDGRRGAIETHRFVNRPLRAVRGGLESAFLPDVEFHCFVVRRRAFDAIGGFDERSEVCDHIDAGIAIANAGGRLFTDTSVLVAYLEDADFAIADIGRHIERWQEIAARDPIGYFARKHGLDLESAFVRNKHAWLAYHGSIVELRRRPATEIAVRNRIGDDEPVHTAEALATQGAAAGFAGMAHTRILHYGHMAAGFLTPPDIPGGVPMLHRSIRAASLLIAHGAPLAPILGALVHAAYRVGRHRHAGAGRPGWQARAALMEYIDRRIEAIAFDSLIADWDAAAAPAGADAVARYPADRAASLLARVADAVAQRLAGKESWADAGHDAAAISAHAAAVLPALGYEALLEDFRAGCGASIRPRAA